MVSAYDQLLARGLVEARPHRGFFVRASARRAARAAAPRAAGRDGAAAAAGAEQRDRADPRHVPAARRPADARASAPCPPSGSIRRCSPRRCARPPRAGRSRSPRCSTAIRPARRGCARRWRSSSPTTASPPRPAQIVTTVGATHALDIVTRTLLRAGDSVLVDEPGWSVEYARLAALGMRVLPVPRGSDGPDVAAMRRLIEAQPPARAAAPLRDRVGAAQPDRRVARPARRAPGAAARPRARLSHRRGRHLRAPRAGARAAPGRARRARAHDLRLRASRRS